MKSAYYRVFHNETHVETTNGAPTLLVDSEPYLSVKKTATGKLVMYFYFKSGNLWMNRPRIKE